MSDQFAVRSSRILWSKDQGASDRVPTTALSPLFRREAALEKSPVVSRGSIEISYASRVHGCRRSLGLLPGKAIALQSSPARSFSFACPRRNREEYTEMRERDEEKGREQEKVSGSREDWDLETFSMDRS